MDDPLGKKLRRACIDQENSKVSDSTPSQQAECTLNKMGHYLGRGEGTYTDVKTGPHKVLEKS